VSISSPTLLPASDSGVYTALSLRTAVGVLFPPQLDYIWRRRNADHQASRSQSRSLNQSIQARNSPIHRNKTITQRRSRPLGACMVPQHRLEGRRWGRLLSVVLHSFCVILQIVGIVGVISWAWGKSRRAIKTLVSSRCLCLCGELNRLLFSLQKWGAVSRTSTTLS
jgi:hypothetical protein